MALSLRSEPPSPLRRAVRELREEVTRLAELVVRLQEENWRIHEENRELRAQLAARLRSLDGQ